MYIDKYKYYHCYFDYYCYIYIYCEVCCCNLNPFAPAAVSNHSGGIFRAILALRLDSASWKSAVVHCRHRIGLDFVGQTPIFALVAELSFVILLATPCTALALSRPLLNFDFICCPGPVLALCSVPRP